MLPSEFDDVCRWICVFLPVSENKVLCHPSSVDSLSTSAGTEDHVSMGGYSARKAVQVVENVERGNLCCRVNPSVSGNTLFLMGKSSRPL